MNSNADGKGYAGQGGLPSGEGEFNNTSFLVEQLLAKISTAKVVKVVAVKSKGEVAAVGFVDVQPLVKQIDGLGNATSHGVIYGVPYLRIAGGKNAVILDPVVGDIGVMVVSDRDISAVKDAKKESTPGSFRRYDAADGIYIGGILSDAPEQYVTFTDTGIKVADKNGATFESKAGYWSIADKSSNSIVGSATGWAFAGICTFQNNVQFGGAIKSQTGATYGGDFVTTGSVKSGTIDLQAHHHTAQGANAPTTGAQP